MTTLVQEGDESIRIIKDLHSFFDTRARSLTIVSIGFGRGCLERVLHEETRSAIHLFECRPEQLAATNAFLQFLQDRQPSAFLQFPWLQSHVATGMSSSALKLETKIPSLVEGSVVLKGTSLQCTPFPFTHMDILKLDMKDATEWILYQILHAGFRPGLVFLRWDRHPDKYSDAMLCAGHLQQVGYHLYGQEGSWFSYRFIDNCTYEYCSWARTDCVNPLLQAHEELVRTNILTGSGKPLTPK
jgi:hypothetical protein